MPPLLGAVPRGILRALGLVAGAAAATGAALALGAVAPASPELLRSIALIGASLVLAYIIEAVWLIPRVEIDEHHGEWLGFIVGAALAGFLGVVISLLLAEHRAAGHDNLLDSFGLAWSAVSLLILGVTLIAHPLLADRYRDAASPPAVKEPAGPSPGS